MMSSPLDLQNGQDKLDEEIRKSFLEYKEMKSYCKLSDDAPIDIFTAGYIAAMKNLFRMRSEL